MAAVVCGFPVNRMLAVSIGDLCRVLGLGGLFIRGRGRANVVVGVGIDRAVGGVGAVLAGLVGLPAALHAGRGLPVVGFELVVLVIYAADLPTARAGFRHRVLALRACA